MRVRDKRKQQKEQKAQKQSDKQKVCKEFASQFPPVLISVLSFAVGRARGEASRSSSGSSSNENYNHNSSSCDSESDYDDVAVAATTHIAGNGEGRIRQSHQAEERVGPKREGRCSAGV